MDTSLFDFTKEYYQKEFDRDFSKFIKTNESWSPSYHLLENPTQPVVLVNCWKISGYFPYIYRVLVSGGDDTYRCKDFDSFDEALSSYNQIFDYTTLYQLEELGFTNL